MAFRRRGQKIAQLPRLESSTSETERIDKGLAKIKFVQGENGAENTVEMPIPELIIAGWTGSDEKAVNEDIDELAAIGIPRPTTVPIYFRVAATRRASPDSIQVSGPDPSGRQFPEPYRSTNGFGASAFEVSIHTDFCCKYSLIISWPDSRPMPERL